MLTVSSILMDDGLLVYARQGRLADACIYSLTLQSSDIKWLSYQIAVIPVPLLPYAAQHAIEPRDVCPVQMCDDLQGKLLTW